MLAVTEFPRAASFRCHSFLFSLVVYRTKSPNRPNSRYLSTLGSGARRTYTIAGLDFQYFQRSTKLSVCGMAVCSMYMWLQYFQRNTKVSDVSHYQLSVCGMAVWSMYMWLQYFQRSTKLSDVNRRLKSQIWSSVVTIVLVEGKNLLPMDMDGFSDPYAKFRLGSEKYKSRVVYKSLNPSWLEQFDLHLYDDQSQELEVTLWDKDRAKDDLMGRCMLDLSQLEREKTHRIWQELEEGAGSIFLLLTISGTTASETISDLTTYEDNPREREALEQRYVRTITSSRAYMTTTQLSLSPLQSRSETPLCNFTGQYVLSHACLTVDAEGASYVQALVNTFQNLRDVGHLTVKVYRAQGLAAADLGGKSDPFCVLELVNARLQTQTEYKTLMPSWQKIFTLCVQLGSASKSVRSSHPVAMVSHPSMAILKYSSTSVQQVSPSLAILCVVHSHKPLVTGFLHLLKFQSKQTVTSCREITTVGCYYIDTSYANPECVSSGVGVFGIDCAYNVSGAMEWRFGLLLTSVSIRVLRADEDDVGSSIGVQGLGKGEIPENNRRQVASRAVLPLQDCGSHLTDGKVNEKRAPGSLKSPRVQQMCACSRSNVKDINSVLEVTVYDEDRDHKVEFLGKVAIPLLRIHNGEKKWYALKDKKLYGRAKGNCPQILLELTVIWNPIRACIRTLNPKEEKYMQTEVKFKRQVFVRNVMRLKAIIMFFIELGKYIHCARLQHVRTVFANHCLATNLPANGEPLVARGSHSYTRPIPRESRGQSEEMEVMWRLHHEYVCPQDVLRVGVDGAQCAGTGVLHSDVLLLRALHAARHAATRLPQALPGEFDYLPASVLVCSRLPPACAR
ncbi:hypothetical protein PR048_015329 [Dryococelus australis]|uniref:C2 domain-containing protein n=1 Tax=Dryococelus australis TaxID=614101 RepID=A0ABQ9HGN4_9NEOP|nr:hypothetical protein PR048_015329 [Dryococelus australis]